MSRVDIPTLKCDRCGATTQDIVAMARYITLNQYTVSNANTWDLCPECWPKFKAFMEDRDDTN